jgi:hypothetical protein
VKRLSQVEISKEVSNQHEFNGIAKFKNIFGTDKKTFDAKYIFISDEDDKIIEAKGFLTWYNAREKDEKRNEHRLYYSENEVMSAAKADDLLVVAQIDAINVVIIIAPKNSTSEKQLLWLFGQEEVGSIFIIKNLSNENRDIGYAGKYIISTLGLEISETATDFLDIITKKFGTKFPTTKQFSEFARSTVKNVDPIAEPDKTLITWLEREELLFKTLEKTIIQQILKNGFGKEGDDVEEFIKVSLSIQNRRKSRAGFSFENNLVALFDIHKIQYSRGAITERNNKPDFIFPGISHYHNNTFNISLLTMLGVKTTAKDRWRQILSEAIKIKSKHLITLEPAISKNQTEDMKANNVQLIIPQPLMATYHPDQQQEIITINDFIKLVQSREGSLERPNTLF